MTRREIHNSFTSKLQILLLSHQEETLLRFASLKPLKDFLRREKVKLCFLGLQVSANNKLINLSWVRWVFHKAKPFKKSLCFQEILSASPQLNLSLQPLIRRSKAWALFARAPNLILLSQITSITCKPYPQQQQVLRTLGLRSISPFDQALRLTSGIPQCRRHPPLKLWLTFFEMSIRKSLDLYSWGRSTTAKKSQSRSKQNSKIARPLLRL